jgi:predicted nucleotidyltransferase
MVFGTIMLIFSMSITSALFTERQSLLFGWLFGQPERSYHLNELIRLTGLGSASVQAELRRLTDAGIVLSERIGNLRRFRANPDSLVFSELTQMTRKLLGVEAQLREALDELQPPVRAAWLFGSIARGTDHAMSDIDVMVVADGLSLSDLIACLHPRETSLGRKINPTLYSVDEFTRRKADPASFVSKVLSGPVISLVESKEFRG